MPRSATSATRLTASSSAGTGMSAVADHSVGNSERYLGNSASSSRVVVRRAGPAKPIMPSPAPPPASARVISEPVVSVFADSASVRAGMSTWADSSFCSGFQASSRTASR